jgi:predicted ATPase with chaperone activity
MSPSLSPVICGPAPELALFRDVDVESAGLRASAFTARAGDELLRAPERIEDLGASEGLINGLFLKHAYRAGHSTLRDLAASLRLKVELVESIFRRLKLQNLFEILGTRGDDFAFALTQAGKTVALERFQQARYCGPAPVPLKSYEAVVRSQVARTRLNRARLTRAYEDLTLPPDLLDRLGPALTSQKSMFLYGPSGTGKSSLAERILRIYDDRIAVPLAVEIEGNIVSVFDPAVHQPTPAQRGDDDPRWVFCSRPSIVVGGELVPAMLELQKDAEAGLFIAPLHMKANNGIFVIDDFGRQQIAPRDLLNRWIVPLDRRIDYLTISGNKFTIPFEVFVVFSTNLNPSELADEAFLRRIPNKILVDSVSSEHFNEIVGRRLLSNRWSVEPGAADHLRNVCGANGGSLRPCYPRDLFQIIESIAEFEERAPVLTAADVDRAAELYFGKTEVRPD